MKVSFKNEGKIFWGGKEHAKVERIYHYPVYPIRNVKRSPLNKWQMTIDETPNLLKGIRNEEHRNW